MKYEVEIMDSDGQTCRINLSLPLCKKRTDLPNSTWHVLDEGRLKYRMGGCIAFPKDGVEGVNDYHLYLFVGEKVMIELFKFIDMYSLANASGAGKLESDKCIGFKPGKISWVLNS